MIKLEALRSLVAEQLTAGHIETSTSPWNSPVFVIKKKSGKWKLLVDLREVNKCIEPMGGLQLGLPSPAMIPQTWSITVIDLKDCFLTIPLQPQDKAKFAFTVPTYNHQQPVERYQWTDLPQGMINSPTLCQEFVARALTPVRQLFPQFILYHYMDDLLLAAPNREQKAPFYHKVLEALKAFGLQVAPEKIQEEFPYSYLGSTLESTQIRPQKIQIRRDHLKTLNDFQKLLGDINWLRPSIGIPTYRLCHLFGTLEGDRALNGPRQLSPQAAKELSYVEQRISQGFLSYLNPQKSVQLILFQTPHSPTGVISQDVAILEWLSLSNQTNKKLQTYIDKIALLIAKGGTRVLQLTGQEPQEITTQLTNAQVSKGFQFNEEWQLALADYPGKLSNHYPHSKLFDFLRQTSVVITNVISHTPVSGITAFIDANKTSEGYWTDQQYKVLPHSFSSVQLAELWAITLALQEFNTVPLNIVSDSRYATLSCSILPDVDLPLFSRSSIDKLFLRAQQLLLQRHDPVYICHV
uniref:Reverse transcriptase n=1 Tax=Equus asinus asinus TaxID=83772 RepID=A0A8C4MTR0_EQUAS